MTMTNFFIPTPGSGCQWGARTIPVRGGAQPETSIPNTVLLREQQLGRKLNIVTFFRPWDVTTYTMTSEATCISGGRCPMVSWPQRNSVPADMTAGINSGKYDTIIHNMGVALNNLGNGVILRLWWEMNGNASDWNNDPSQFISSWRRIWTIMKGSQAQINALSPACTQTAIQAPNIMFYWCVQHRADAADFRWVSLYPGNSYVDLIGQDIYNKNPIDQSFATLMTSGDFNAQSSNNNFYTTFTNGAYGGIPLMVGEYSCMEQNDPNGPGTQVGTKAAWFAQALVDLKASFPAVAVMCQWDSFTGYDWRMDTDMTTFLGSATLNGSITNSATSLTLSSGSGYPTNGPFILKIGSELINCSARATNVVTIAQRGWYGTTAVSHSSGAATTYQGTSTAGTSFQAIKTMVNDPYMNPTPTLPVRSTHIVLQGSSNQIWIA